MSELQYVGARYVPKFADPYEWQANTIYEPLTVVMYNRNSYTSKKQVPANIGEPTNNPEYWVCTGNYNAQIEEITNAIAKEISDRTNADSALDNKIEQEVTDRSNADSALEDKISAEVTARTEADSALDNKIEQEVTDRKNLIEQLSGDTVIKSSGDVLIGGEDISLSPSGNLIYGNPTELNDYFKTVPVMSARGSAYDVLVKTDNTASLYAALKNVKDYGAVGDGTTDDTDAIMSMINDVGYAFFTKGTYACNLSITSECSLFGANAKNTFLTAKDSSKPVIYAKNVAINCTDLCCTGGTSGIQLDSTNSSVITRCITYLNSSYGIYINGKNANVDREGLLQIANCISERNGQGYFIKDYPDFSMIGCVGTSNASAMNNGYNLNISNCAGKIVNSHFFNYNDYAGYYRPKASLLTSGDSEFTNCHIEGGYDVNITIDSGSPSFNNCSIYASFGSYSVWINNSSSRPLFNGCIFGGAAADGESYQPEWISQIGGNGSSYGVLSGCNIYGQIFSNTNFTNWYVSGYVRNTTSTFTDTISPTTAMNVMAEGTYNAIGAEVSSIGGGSTVDLTYNRMAWLTENATLSGNCRVGTRINLFNASASAITITGNFSVYGTTYTLESHKAIDIIKYNKNEWVVMT